MDQPSNAEDMDDLCLCGKGKLREGATELKVRVNDRILVIKNVPALVCNLCEEAYLLPETSRQIDDVMKEYRAGRLKTKPIAADEVDLAILGSAQNL